MKAVVIVRSFADSFFVEGNALCVSICDVETFSGPFGWLCMRLGRFNVPAGGRSTKEVRLKDPQRVLQLEG